jgi:hypothetical protein
MLALIYDSKHISVSQKVAKRLQLIAPQRYNTTL